MSNLLEGADGSLYGTTFNPPAPDGSLRPGIIFKIGPTGEFTHISVAQFLRAGVIQAHDGRLYKELASGGVVAGEPLFSGMSSESKRLPRSHSFPPVRTPRPRKPCRRTRPD